MNKLMILILAFAFSTCLIKASAQKMPSLSYKEDGKTLPLKITNVIIDVKVVGNIATTTMDMTFKSEANRVLEGELSFPLAEGQTVSRFAMEINGRLREGVVVEKAKGREVFEKIVRRGADPGLLEVTKGNTFRSRVYPIPANGTKRIVVAYEQTLQETEDGMSYRLPLDFDYKLDKFRLTAEVYNYSQKPDAEKSEMEGVDFKKEGNGFATVLEYKNYEADEQFEFSLPTSSEDKQSVITEQIKGKIYFYATLRPEILNAPKSMPSKIYLLWDASASSAFKDKKREFELLDKYFNKIGSCSVELVVFSNEAGKPESFIISGGNWDALEKRLDETISDGGTQLGALDLNKYQCDEFLLFTDGISSFGEKEIILSKTPVTVINSSQSAEHGYLQYITQITGGAYINLLNLNNDQALSLLAESPYSFISAEYDPGEVTEFYPRTSEPLTGSFSVSGILLSGSAIIKLNYGIGGRIMKTEELNIDASANTAETGIIQRLWAMRKLSDLRLQPGKYKNEITSLGKEYSIVTPGTSLIVLETIQDYITYRIVPPDDMKQEYIAAISKENEKIHEEELTKNDNLKKKFSKEIEWWQAVYDPKANITAGSFSDSTPASSHYPVNNRIYNARDTIQFSRPGLGTLIGRVNDEASNPVLGATIIVMGTRLGGCSLQRGRYRVINLNPGSYTVKVTAIGFEPYETNISIISDSVTEKDIHLKAIPGAQTSVMVEREKIVETTRTGCAISRNSSESNSSSDDQEPQNQMEADPLAPASGDDSGNHPQFYTIRGSRGNETIIVMDENSIEYNSANVEGQPSSMSGNIILHSYESDAPYTSDLSNASSDNIYEKYLSFKDKYGRIPGFYMDVADIAMKKGSRETALRILSNIAELELENASMLRILGYRLQQWGYFKQAILVFREVLKMREEEPQSYRDLALDLAEDGQYQEAADLLYKVATRQWDTRFPEVELIVIHELNNMIANHGDKINTQSYDTSLVKSMPVDVRVVLNWDSDNCDMDLWVTGPDGEKCFYGHPKTAIGGKISRDFTGGYGPEEFMLKKAIPGKYKVQADYFGTEQQNMRGPVTLFLQLFTKYGTREEKKKVITMRFDGHEKQVVDVGEFVIE